MVMPVVAVADGILACEPVVGVVVVVMVEVMVLVEVVVLVMVSVVVEKWASPRWSLAVACPGVRPVVVVINGAACTGDFTRVSGRA
jgi:hypothetical protein